MAHIAIVGEMGVGKSTVGAALASRLGRPLLDSDQVIVDRTGSSGLRIAAEEGVGALHDLELEIFESMSRSVEPAVITPAASVVDDGGARAMLSTLITVWLVAAPDTIEERRQEGSHRRPVTGEESIGLRQARDALYAGCARHRIDVTALSVAEVVDRIVGLV